MMKPTIHLNGTNWEALLEQQASTMTAISNALQALRNSAPNARDYYPQGPEAFHTADLEHRARVSKLELVFTEIEAIAEHVMEAGMARAAR